MTSPFITRAVNDELAQALITAATSLLLAVVVQLGRTARVARRTRGGATKDMPVE